MRIIQDALPFHTVTLRSCAPPGDGAANRPSMGKHGEFPMNDYFPHPTVQAMFLLDETGNDLETAIELARMNTRTEDIGDIRFWVAVVNALTLNEQKD